MGLTSSVIPFCPSLLFFFVLCGINGFVMGSLNTGGNVLCLDIWQGLDDSGPYMHSIHFSYGLGAFLAPIVAEHFLRKNDTNVNYDTGPPEKKVQGESLDSNEKGAVKSGPGLDTLYPILGVYAIIVSIGYLIFAVKGYQKNKNH